MKEDIKELWVNALPSYKQDQDRLRTSYGFCCLGVLCDLYLKEMGEGWVIDVYKGLDGRYVNYYMNDYENEFLPKEVMDWAGLSCNNPNVEYQFDGDDVPNSYPISDLNDMGVDFETISKVIQDQL